MKKTFTFWMESELHTKVKMLCAKIQMSVAAYVVSLIESDLKKRGEI